LRVANFTIEIRTRWCFASSQHANWDSWGKIL